MLRHGARSAPDLAESVTVEGSFVDLASFLAGPQARSRHSRAGSQRGVHRQDRRLAQQDDGDAAVAGKATAKDAGRGKRTLVAILGVDAARSRLAETVDEAIFSVQDAASAKPLSIEQQIQEHLPKLRTDLTKINQIVFLLLENAVKFTPSGKITIRSWIEDERLHCEIADTGIGIAADDRAYVFDEFFQVDEGSSARYSGSGLGLALVRDLIVLLEGDIQLASEIGQGTTVSFSIPVQIVG